MMDKIDTLLTDIDSLLDILIERLWLNDCEGEELQFIESCQSMRKRIGAQILGEEQ